MKLRINVTAQDIKYGRPEHGEACPIARAVRRTKVGKQAVFSVGASYIYTEARPEMGRVVLPSEATDFIRAFDRHLPVEPFTFMLEVPE